jgi:hypothetical protein
MTRIAYLAPEKGDLLSPNINLYRALTYSPDATRSFLGLAPSVGWVKK